MLPNFSHCKRFQIFFRDLERVRLAIRMELLDVSEKTNKFVQSCLGPVMKKPKPIPCILLLPVELV